MNQQPFDPQTIDDTEKNKNIVKVVIIAAAVAIAVVVAVVFFFLYSGNDSDSSSSEGESIADVESGDVSHNGSGETVNSSELNDSSKENVDASSDASNNNASNDNTSANASSDMSDESTSEDSSSDSSEDNYEEPDHRWVKNAMGYTYLYNGQGFNQFNGTQSLAEKYAGAVNNFSSSVFFPVYSIIAPTSVEFVDIPNDVKREDDFYNSSQKKFISYVNSALLATPVDAYTPISEKVAEEYLYLKTDRNWTADAAYYAYAAFCNATGNIVPAKNAYEMGSYSGYLGNFYNATLSGKLKANADTVNFYKISAVYPCNVTRYSGGLATKDQALIYSQLTNPTSLAYYVFLGDRGESFKITSQNSASERTVLVIGDESAFAFVPFLVANYRTVYFVNTEAFKGNMSTYLADKTIDEAVVISYATNAATSSYINKLNTIFAPAGE